MVPVLVNDLVQLVPQDRRDQRLQRLPTTDRLVGWANEIIG